MAKLKAKTPIVVLSQADTPTSAKAKRARTSSGSAEQPATPDAIAQAVAFITCAADAQDSAKDADKMALGKQKKTKSRRK